MYPIGKPGKNAWLMENPKRKNITNIKILNGKLACTWYRSGKPI